MRSVTITLGGKEYTVTQLPLRKNVAWQHAVAVHLKEILKVIPNLMSIIEPVIKQGAAKSERGATQSILDAITAERLPELVATGGDLLVGAVDAMPVMLDLIYEFDEPLKLDAERIEAEVTEEEVVRAFVEIAKLSFPFGQKVGELLKGLTTPAAPQAPATGSGTETTSLSSPAPSGDSGTTS